MGTGKLIATESTLPRTRIPRTFVAYAFRIMIDYNDRFFRPVQNTDNGETSAETLFHYKQEGNILTSEYKGGRIILGHLIGLVDEEGHIRMHYHQVNDHGEIMTGVCHSTPEILSDGRIRLHELWAWTSGDRSEGRSVLEEVSAWRVR